MTLAMYHLQCTLMGITWLVIDKVKNKDWSIHWFRSISHHANKEQLIASFLMYVTRPLSLYRNNQKLLSLPHPEGPASGYLVLQDVEEFPPTCCGLTKDKSLKDPPFPQNKLLSVEYMFGDVHYGDKALFIPVIDQPLSSNRYYVIAVDKHKGLAYTSATEEDSGTTCCCNSSVPEETPIELNPHNGYQQFEIFKKSKREFSARSLPPDGFPPGFLRQQWRIIPSEPTNFFLGEASGLNSSLRAQLPNFDFPLSFERSQPLKVGKWYCPFMFVKDGVPREQMERSMFYEMTLEQRWERIFTCKKSDVKGDTVNVDVLVPTECVNMAVRDEANGIMWFRSTSQMCFPMKVGLRLVIVERMIWEEERVGWLGGYNKQVKVVRREKYQGDSWTEFGCYMLVEQFVLKRLDGSLVLTCDFNHTHQIMPKWE